jgi:hypothetical protein
MTPGRILVVNLPGKGRNGAVFIGHGANGIPTYVLANPRRLGETRPDGGVWTRNDSLDLYVRELRGLSDTGRDVALWNGVPLTPCERAEKRAELNRLYRIVAGGGTLRLDHFCRSGSTGVPCTGDMIALVLNEALDARAANRACGVTP